MNSIAAFQMAKALDEERHRYVETRRQRVDAAQNEVPYNGGRSWRLILRFPRAMTVPSKG